MQKFDLNKKFIIVSNINRHATKCVERVNNNCCTVPWNEEGIHALKTPPTDNTKWKLDNNNYPDSHTLSMNKASLATGMVV